MASKRKSTVPCMIPSKTKHMREEIILGCLPELLPTIPEDSILSISGEEGGHSSHDSSRPDGGDRWQRGGGTFSCPPCRFEARDLNFFLDHLHNCHVDFRAQASFYCLNCGVSVVRFEALALHNAKAHPGLLGGSVNASLHVRKRDGLTTVEQSLFTANGEDFSDLSSGISLTKTPIVKMMKTKGEHKKIVVSHTVEVRRIDTGGKEMERTTDPTMNLMNVPELQNGGNGGNGAPTMLRKPVTHVVTTVSNQAFHHQHTPSLYSSSSSDSNKDLPKVMIPLSSIPTYDAAMDTSSFLKTSFGKFPYPTKAELCYLTVVSDFPEEQIKLWFTAHRLKQGISWSPEEIEEARRKMFNTVFQATAPQKQQPPKPRHTNHTVTHHTITAQPTPMGLHCHTSKVLHGGLISRQTGVIASQTSIGSPSQQVTSRVTYAVPAITTKYPPMVVRTTQVLTRNTVVPTLESDKSVGLGLDMAGSNSCVISTRSSSSASSCSSSSSISSSSSVSSNGGENGTKKSTNNNSLSHSVVSCSTNVSNNDECGVANSEKPYGKSNSMPSVLETFCSSSNNKSKVIMNTTSKSNVICNSHSNSSSISNQDQYPSATIDDDSNNNYSHKSNNGSVISDYPSISNNNCINDLNHASIAQNENTSTTVITKSSSSSISIVEEKKCIKEFPLKGMSVLQQLIKEEDPVEDNRTCPELNVDPTKINPRRLKVNEPKAKPGSEAVPPELTPEIQEIPTSHLSFSAPWGKKTPQQVHLLRQAFSSTHWPSSQQYEELSVITCLPKPEVVRWFSDSRYIHKNGQLKWLEGYQHLPEEGEEGGMGFTDPGAETLRDLQRKLAEQDVVNKQLDEVPGRLTAWQQGVWRDTYTPLLGLTGTEETGERGQAVEAVKTGYLQDHWAESEDEHQQPVSSQAFVEQQTEGSQARDRLRIELLEV